MHERADVCIIGSGAGGAVIAYEAARRGLRTLILERGPYVRADDMTASEIEMIPRLYKDGGLQMNTTLDLFILQGSCVGGSTVISNMVLMRPDDAIFARWSRRAAELDVEALRGSFHAIERLLDARHPAASASSRTTELFESGARKIGMRAQPMLKALGDCHACGNCNIGCTFDTKRNALTTFIHWAQAEGARVLPDTDALRVKIRAGRAVGVEALTGAARARLSVDARLIVISAGAIGSSAVLLESGVQRNVGTRLSFNAGAMMVADFDEVVDAYDSDQMTRYLKTDDYLIEATHNPLMSTALTTPGWMSVHGALMQRSRHLAYAGAMVGTDAVGQVVMSRWFGHEETRFRATDRDMRRLRDGLKKIAEVFLAAGARRVLLPTHEFIELRSLAEICDIDRRIRSLRDLQCGSSHPQGGNPMSDDPALGVVDSKLRVHGVDGLFVCDASVFPDSVEVNPMNTVMAIAHHRAKDILAHA